MTNPNELHQFLSESRSDVFSTIESSISDPDLLEKFKSRADFQRISNYFAHPLRTSDPDSYRTCAPWMFDEGDYQKIQQNLDRIKLTLLDVNSLTLLVNEGIVPPNFFTKIHLSNTLGGSEVDLPSDFYKLLAPNARVVAFHFSEKNRFKGLNTLPFTRNPGLEQYLVTEPTTDFLKGRKPEYIFVGDYAP